MTSDGVLKSEQELPRLKGISVLPNCSIVMIDFADLMLNGVLPFLEIHRSIGSSQYSNAPFCK
jgi:hypothetical protein